MTPWLTFCAWRIRQLVAALERWEMRFVRGRAKLPPLRSVEPKSHWPTDDPRPRRPQQVRDANR
jgi:hypothetical protein